MDLSPWQELGRYVGSKSCSLAMRKELVPG